MPFSQEKMFQTMLNDRSIINNYYWSYFWKSCMEMFFFSFTFLLPLTISNLKLVEIGCLGHSVAAICYIQVTLFGCKSWQIQPWAPCGRGRGSNLTDGPVKNRLEGRLPMTSVLDSVLQVIGCTRNFDKHHLV